MRIVWAGVLAALTVLFGVVAASPATNADDGVPIDIGAENECLGAVPHVPTDPLGGPVTVQIAVAGDRVPSSASRRIVQAAELPYRTGPAGSPDVSFEIADVHNHNFKSAEVTGFITSPEQEGDDLMSQLIRHYREEHPNLVRDHVHLVTAEDIYVTFEGERLDAILGIDNCIGSIGLPSLSYSISEAGVLSSREIAGLTFLSDLDAKVAAHEIGHAFGAHHHYANCAENALALAEAKGDPCTLMYNDASLIGMRFSALSTGAVRGYAEAHVGIDDPGHDHGRGPRS